MPSEPGAPSPPGVIPLCVPTLKGNEWAYVKECLDSNWVSSAGPFVERFERLVASYIGAKYAVATANGTAALHIALLLAGVGPEHEVLVPTLTFIAPANTVRYVGAWPVLMDVEQEYWQIDVKKVADFLEKGCVWRDGELCNKHSRRQVKAILPVHILGHPCDMDPLVELARKYNLVLIEDATESLGAQYKGRSVGLLGDVACLSFNGNKIITTGGGGMIVTNNGEWASKARYLTTQAKDDPVEYVHNEIGFNYRLSNLQAALGVAQVEQMSGFIKSKRRIASTYTSLLANVPGVRLPRQAPWARNTFWLYTILVGADTKGCSRRCLMRELRAVGIETRPLWQPVHRQVPYLGCQAYSIEVADRLHEESLSLPCSVSMEERELQYVARELLKALGKASS